eukprot:TRINITY_DN325_c0_g9_i1.p3 TRINITY_DN325_c0_g9~~TRINITY_DN325_c0_g9_i1.p3  ORF type:complete len:133 (-),score=7.63 TRINITY_DN325_c0_g9_i1:410-808(-)
MFSTFVELSAVILKICSNVGYLIFVRFNTCIWLLKFAILIFLECTKFVRSLAKMQKFTILIFACAKAILKVVVFLVYTTFEIKCKGSKFLTGTEKSSCFLVFLSEIWRSYQESSDMFKQQQFFQFYRKSKDL